MQWEKPFELDENDIALIKKCIEHYGNVIEKTKELIKELNPKDITDEDKNPEKVAVLVGYLNSINTADGICHYLNQQSEYLHDYRMLKYYKHKHIPYSAYWGAIPKECKRCSEVLATLILRFNNMNEALILAKI